MLRSTASLLLLSAPALAQGSDSCAAPTPISGAGTFAYDNSAATDSGFTGGDPVECGQANAGQAPIKDVFFVWTPTSAGDHAFTTCAGGLDTVLNLHLGSNCSATCLDGEDGGDCGGGVQVNMSVVTVSGVTLGSSYLVQVGMWDATSALGPGALEVSLLGGGGGGGGGPTGSNDTCAGAIAITGVGFLTYDNTAATTSGFDGGDPVTCAPSSGLTAPAKDLFYAWTVPQDGSYRIHTCVSGLDTVLNLHDGGDCAATCRIGADFGTCSGLDDAEVILIGGAAGDVHLIQVGSWDGTSPTGPVDLQIELLPPSNDTCVAPAVISGEGVWALDNQAASSSGFVGGDPTTCGTAEGAAPPHKDLFFAWSADCNGEYTFTTCPDIATDSVINVYLGSDCSATCLGGADDSPCDAITAAEVVLAPVSVGQEFLIQIGGWAADPAQVVVTDLHVIRTGAPCPPPIDIQCDPNNAHHLGGDVKLNTSSFGSGVGADFHLEATDGPPTEFGFFIVSRSGTNAAPLFQGILCLDLPLGRYDPNNALNQGVPGLNSIGQFDAGGVFQNLSGSSTTGTGFDVPLELPAGPGPGDVAPGDVLVFQLWYRDLDPMGAPSANFSNSVQVLFP